MSNYGNYSASIGYYASLTKINVHTCLVVKFNILKLCIEALPLAQKVRNSSVSNIAMFIISMHVNCNVS